MNIGTVVDQVRFHSGDSQATSIRLEPESPFSMELVRKRNYYATSGNIKISSSLKDTDIFECNLTFKRLFSETYLLHFSKYLSFCLAILY